uniref:Uncharacterized protein n=1 Tax=Malurus cyaneus samueli TaxID=2593467 RepID=A0A8C5TKR4_9PASS
PSLIRKNTPRVRQNEPLTSALHTTQVSFLCEFYHPINLPPPTSFISCTPLPPHPQPHRPSPAAQRSPSARQGSRTAEILAPWHTCGPGSLRNIHSWENSKTEKGPGLVGRHPGRLEEVRSSCLQPLGCDGKVHTAGQAAEHSLPGICY